MSDSMSDPDLSPGQSVLDAPLPMPNSSSGGTATAADQPVDPPASPSAERDSVKSNSVASDSVETNSSDDDAETDPSGEPTVRTGAKRRRRGSRGGKNRKRPPGSESAEGGADDDEYDDDADDLDDADSGSDGSAGSTAARSGSDSTTLRGEGASVESKPSTRQRTARSKQTVQTGSPADQVELPDVPREGRPNDVAAAAAALVPKAPPARPRIGDTRPAPPPPPGPAVAAPIAAPAGDAKKSRNAKRKPKDAGEPRQAVQVVRADVPTASTPTIVQSSAAAGGASTADGSRSKRGRRKKDPSVGSSVLEADIAERRRGRERNGRPVGRYMMAVQVRSGLTQVAVLEGRNLIEHYVSRPSDDVAQIHGNIYLGRVQNVLPGMEAAFVDIATPKNAVLYRGDVQFDQEDIVERSADKPRIEQMLRNRQLIVCQVTKNPIGAKGARLTQEVSLPGRFVVLIPNSSTYGISKRLPDDERKRLRSILDRVKPAEHGLIVRTAAETATEQELRGDVTRLVETWNKIEAQADVARKANKPALLYREPELAVRVIREEFNAEYRTVSIDDKELFEEVRGYVTVMNPELADRIEYHDAQVDGLPLYERHHVHEQIHKALDRKVWLPSGGSLIIDHTEAMTVIDVNTGKNVGKSNLEETVFHNNLEAAEEIARQLRLRDIGGIIVIDFIDMEIKENRKRVVESFRSALSRDKTRSQVFDISELGLVEMTRKRIGEGLLTSFAEHCPNCAGRGVVVDFALLD